jgi:NDP-sugar pyrophosphorylase family protein
MIPSQALILCAGMGTRLGRISSIIPKAMLPLFDKRLIDYQIEYLYQVGVTDIYINVFHLAESLERHVLKHYKNIKIVKEENLLGSGGVFHNLKRLGVKGKILAINVDTLYFIERKLNEVFSASENHQLLSMTCEPGATYNRMEADASGKLQRITGYQESKSSITFSGMSLINLDILHYQEGVSSFFSSVCIPGIGNVSVVQEFGLYEFYDFGTIQDYALSFKKLTSSIATSSGLWKQHFPAWEKMVRVDRQDQVVLELTDHCHVELDLIKGELSHQ